MPPIRNQQNERFRATLQLISACRTLTHGPLSHRPFIDLHQDLVSERSIKERWIHFLAATSMRALRKLRQSSPPSASAAPARSASPISSTACAAADRTSAHRITVSSSLLRGPLRVESGPSPEPVRTARLRRFRPFAGCNASRWLGPALPSARRLTQNVLAERGRWRCLLRGTASARLGDPPVGFLTFNLSKRFTNAQPITTRICRIIAHV